MSWECPSGAFTVILLQAQYCYQDQTPGEKGRQAVADSRQSIALGARCCPCCKVLHPQHCFLYDPAVPAAGSSHSGFWFHQICAHISTGTGSSLCMSSYPWFYNRRQGVTKIPWKNNCEKAQTHILFSNFAGHHGLNYYLLFTVWVSRSHILSKWWITHKTSW